jgi:hypothetical protein
VNSGEEPIGSGCALPVRFVLNSRHVLYSKTEQTGIKRGTVSLPLKSARRVDVKNNCERLE